MKRNAKDIILQLLDFTNPQQFYTLTSGNSEILKDFFSGTLRRTKTLDETKIYCKEIEEHIENKTYFPYYIYLTGTETPIGIVDFKNINWEIPKAEIGYFVDKEFAGQGIATIAVDKAIALMQKKYQFKKMLSRVGTKNTASARVALKNGFILEGTIRCDYRTTDKELVDLEYYGRVFN